jgi:hypothetical protein
MKRSLAWVTAFGLFATIGQAAEMRTWMSRKGGTLEAQLGTVQGDSVTLINKDSKEIKLKIEDLSLADRQHLVEVGGADAAIIAGGKPGFVEKDVRLDSATFKKVEGKLAFPDGPSEGFDLFETPHFLIATTGSMRPQPIAETAERLWYGMAFQHMNFRQDWGDKRMLIMLVEDRDAYAALGKWYSGYVAASGDQDGARRVSATWDQTGSTSIYVTDEMATKHNIEERALVFNVKEENTYRKAMSPFPTHSIAGTLLGKQMGGVSSYGSEGYFAITTGHSYFKEISLAGKSETHLLSVEGTGQDEISSKRGFDDGSSWARSLRPLVRSGKVVAQLGPMLKWKPEELTPERLVLIYSFAYYMQSDSKRLAAFAKMVRRIESSNQIPPPDEIAKIFGFETVEAFEADWATFIKEGDFK